MATIYNGTDMPNYNLNKSTSTGLAPAVQEYYDRTFLENMKPKLIHTQFAQKVGLPRNNGRTVKFRKWTPFAALTTPLTEGTVPDGQSLDMTSIQATIDQYGGYVTITDVVDMTSAVPVARDAVKMMGEQGALSIDHMARNAIHEQATNIQYANGKTAIGSIAATDVLTTAEIRKAVRTLKKAKAPMFSRGGKEYYICIVSPDAVYDLQSDSAWVAVSQYQDKENIYSGEIGRMFGVLFVENTEATIYGASEITAKVASYSTNVITLDSPLTDDQIYDLTKCGKVVVGSNAAVAIATNGVTKTTITLAAGHGITPAASDTIAAYGPGASGANVALSVVLGRDAYGCVELDNANVRTIVKNAGSAGTADPLEQVSTIGWKVNGFVTKVLQPTWYVDIVHGVTA